MGRVAELGNTQTSRLAVAVRAPVDSLLMPTKSSKRTKRTPAKPVGLFGTGNGRKVTVEGTRPCMGCGRDVHLSFYGASDSLGVRTTRAALKKGLLCEPCTDRHDEAEVAQEIAERREHHRLSRIEHAGVPERWQPVTFDALEHDAARQDAIAAAMEWARADSPRGLLLHGLGGRGKTVIAAAATMERLQRRRARWIKVAKLLTDLRGGFDGPLYQRALRRIDPAEFDGAMILDDLDKLRPTEHSLQPLYLAIDGCIEKPQPLLVTMNRSPEKLAEWAGETFGEALTSRLVGYSNVVEVKGRDRRMD